MRMKDCIDREIVEYDNILKELPDGTKVSVRDLQENVLKIMDEIDRVCKKNDIKYCLIAGSALGICNYKGFIPWDDDMDIAILREDYPRFLDAMKKDLGDEFYFHCFDTHKKYNVFIPTMKVRLKNTYIEEVNTLLANRCPGNGVFVDVVIYDNISENKFQDEFYRTLVKLIMLPSVLLDNLRINPYHLKKLVVRLSEKYADKNKNSKYISQQVCIPWEKFMKEPVFLKEDVLPFKLYDFEGRKYYSYNNIENVLKKWYGTNCLKKKVDNHYEETLPREKRHPKHVKDINLNGEGPLGKK